MNEVNLTPVNRRWSSEDWQWWWLTQDESQRNTSAAAAAPYTIHQGCNWVYFLTD